jgi:hypothetical protein
MREIKESRRQGLDPPPRFGEIAAARRREPMAQGRRIVWLNVLTVVSAAILIGAEVFGAAFAASWALATLFDLGNIGARVLDVVFVVCGVVVMAQFIRNAHRIEPFTARS